MKAIVAVDKKWGIGKDGQLLTYLPTDLKYFKEKTLGHIVIMGRKTLESLPKGKPLPNRENIVLSNKKEFRVDGAAVCKSIEDVLSCVGPRNAFVIGGEMVYKEFMPYVDEILVTMIDKTFIADKHFIDLDKEEEWALKHLKEEIPIQTENGINFQFLEYIKMSK